MIFMLLSTKRSAVWTLPSLPPPPPNSRGRAGRLNRGARTEGSNAPARPHNQYYNVTTCAAYVCARGCSGWCAAMACSARERPAPVGIAVEKRQWYYGKWTRTAGVTAMSQRRFTPAHPTK